MGIWCFIDLSHDFWRNIFFTWLLTFWRWLDVRHFRDVWLWRFFKRHFLGLTLGSLYFCIHTQYLAVAPCSLSLVFSQKNSYHAKISWISIGRFAGVEIGFKVHRILLYSLMMVCQLTSTQQIGGASISSISLKFAK